MIYSKPSVIINVFSKTNIPSEFEETVKNVLEKKYNYNVLDLTQTNDYGVELGKLEIDCKTKSCYLALKKKIKSSYLLNVNVIGVFSAYSKKYKFKIVLVNLKTGLEEGKKLFFYKERLSNISSLKSFSESSIESFFLAIDKDKAKKELEELKKIPKTLTRKDIVAMVKDVYPDVKNCGKKNNAKGIVKVYFKINRDGSVSNIKFLSKLGLDVKVCLENTLSKMKTQNFTGDPLDIKFPLKLD